jgi:hypothetical protein
MKGDRVPPWATGQGATSGYMPTASVTPTLPNFEKKAWISA